MSLFLGVLPTYPPVHPNHKHTLTQSQVVHTPTTHSPVHSRPPQPPFAALPWHPAAADGSAHSSGRASSPGAGIGRTSPAKATSRRVKGGQSAWSSPGGKPVCNRVVYSELFIEQKIQWSCSVSLKPWVWASLGMLPVFWRNTQPCAKLAC